MKHNIWYWMWGHWADVIVEKRVNKWLDLCGRVIYFGPKDSYHITVVRHKPSCKDEVEYVKKPIIKP